VVDVKKHLAFGFATSGHNGTACLILTARQAVHLDMLYKLAMMRE
jgi:hypothetical protein